MDAGLQKISVLIAAYNEERFIREAVLSCLGQTYPNMEVCVTDDGSSDSTFDVLSSINDPRVKVFRFKENKGKVAAFNRSYENATGDYIALLGADDVALKDRFELSYNTLLREGADQCFGNFIIVDENLKEIGRSAKRYRAEEVNLDRLLFGNFVGGSTILFTRKAASLAFPIPETLRFEDWWIAFQTLLRGGKVSFIEESLILYRQHGRNSNSLLNSNDVIPGKIKDFKRHFEYYRIFDQQIESSDISRSDKRRLRSIIRLSRLFKELYIEESIFKRLRMIPTILLSIKPTLLFLKVIIVLIGGARLTEGLKRLS